MMREYKILAIDDDENILSLVCDILEKEDYIVITATNTDDGYKKAISSHPDLIMLDIKMPKIGGIELCRLLRQDPITKIIPIIMLTVESMEVDKIIGFGIGADDYITKPFSSKEFVARVRSLLRRSVCSKESPEVIKSDNLEINTISKTVKINKKEIHLRPKEFDLLIFFIRKHNMVLTRQQLLESVFGYNVPVPSRTVDTHVKNLRHKLGSFGKKIKTIFGFGFKFVP
ncbi:MAG: response regulator transcription factor [Elusimicrobiota bacterium]